MLNRFFYVLTLFFWLLLTPTLGAAQGTITFTEVQVNDGQNIYKETCQICHGNRLSNGQFGTPLRGNFFRKNWAGKSLGELVQHTWEKMPPDNVKSLSLEEVTAVLSFILSRNELPASSTAMTTEMDTLNAIPLPWK